MSKLDVDQPGVDALCDEIEMLRAQLKAVGAGGVSSQRITHPGGIERGMREVASQYAHRMALSLECILLDYSGKWSGEAVRVLSEYRDAMSAIHESDSPTYMGEPICATLPTL